MRTFRCVCGNSLFFESSHCLACGRTAGWCPQCCAITGFDRFDEAGATLHDGLYRCAWPGCGTLLRPCRNYAVENVCNRMLLANPGPGDASAELFCDYCRYNGTIPDLSVTGNAAKWYRLECAKRRVLYELDLLALPYGHARDGFALPLRFDFKADDPVGMGDDRGFGRLSEVTGPVFTGHASGCITINLREADDVERERLRVGFGEQHRTLVGHFRHELGHYYWQLLVGGREEARFRNVFGHWDDPPYAQALDRYYREGAAIDWPQRHVSAYASMHPWEDFAETFALYLAMMAMLDTAANGGLIAPVARTGNIAACIEAYGRLAPLCNELNRGMGLPDLLPYVILRDVAAKLRFIDEIVRTARETRITG